MDNSNYKLLIVHPAYSKHIRRFIRRLKEYNNDAHIDFLTTCNYVDDVPSDISEYTDNIIYIKLLQSEKFYNKVIRFIYNYFYVKKQIKLISKHNYYDVINIHYPNMYMAFGAKYYKKMCKELLVSPWGSDVYQLNSVEKYFIRKIYQVSDKVSGIGNKFTRDFQKMFGVPDDKIENLTLASETADYLNANKGKITKEEAKEKLGINGYYGIVCSYNGNPIGNHIQMFEAIKKIKSEIPEPIMILVQITYGYTEQYLRKLKNYIKDNCLDAIFFEKYLNLDELYCLMVSADMFVFVSDSDSNSGVLKEYIYMGKKVVLGEWLKYDDLLKCDPLPYFPVRSLSYLDEAIKEAYYSESRPVDPEWKRNFEKAGYNYWTPKWNDYYKLAHNK